MTAYHLHLVSDATGETINSVVRACVVQFEGVEPIEHVWTLIRTRGQMDKVLTGIGANPGPVLYTLVNPDLRSELIEGCRRLAVPCVSVLDPVIHALATYFGVEVRGRSGLQHALDADYYDRIEAMNFTLSHDDGQGLADIAEADVILLGVSRTSKTPTSIYLANRGIRAANVPFVPGVPLASEILAAKTPLKVGLTKDANSLVQVRKNRMRLIAETEQATSYIDPEAVREELAMARRICGQNGWPMIDVTRRSIEETAAAIMTLLAEHRGGGGA